ncbi:hypothetical protein K458DRAFT_296867 [Lentithecium fluviatile CBS 122367]|uniref:PHD-type domain-containing protein n=1 Tax=Lentithecium fluviatile CBS 122367 TaxID=1168545 RepID=A0A6G1JAF2_9PLEO|nr:hypothetical protein K458DRAFT_296867 [Lentithecium fluviatile CBS 122367]
MDPADSQPRNPAASNRPPNPLVPSQPAPKAPIPPAPWASQTSTFAANESPSFPQFSAATAEILKRLQANQGNATGTPAFEAKRAEVLQNYVTSDKLPTPPPVANAGRRGRGGRVGTPSALKGEPGVSSMGSTPASGRGSGRGRGRGRGGARGGKRKRAETQQPSDTLQDDSDISSSYTPLPTRTKSGRNVNRPVTFVPTIPEPTTSVKRRRSTKTILAAQCKICHRGTDPSNNRIVFCDVCTTAYHQYCHDPPIDNEVVNVLEKEWLCGPCGRAKQHVIEGTYGLVAAEGLSIDEKRAYFTTLPQPHLISLLLHATIRHPELPIFPPNVQDLIPKTAAPTTTAPSKQPLSLPISTPQPQPLQPQSVLSPPNGHNSTSGASDMDPAEAQLLGEIRRSTAIITHPSPPTRQPQPANTTTADPSTPQPITPAAPHTNAAGEQLDEYDDGYDTDPPAHYPKPGHGLARTLRPDSEDLGWLVDDNFEVFSHGWKGDGSGVGTDGTFTGLDGVESGKA